MMRQQALTTILGHVASAKRAMREDLAEPNPSRDGQTELEYRAYGEGFYTGMGLAPAQLVEEFGGTKEQRQDAYYLAAFENDGVVA